MHEYLDDTQTSKHALLVTHKVLVDGNFKFLRVYKLGVVISQHQLLL